MFSKKGTPDLAVVGCIIGVIALIVGMVGIATPAPTLGSTPPNHPPLMFWGTPTDSITINAQGSGQRSPLAYAPKASGANDLNKAITTSAWCTGITAGPLTTTTTDKLEVRASYTIKDTNVTGGWWINAVVYLNNVVPATTFQSGNCASLTGASLLGQTIYCPDTAHNCPGMSYILPANKVAGTYYAWIQINSASAAATINSIGSTGASVVIEDISQTNAPPTGLPSASSNLGIWTVFPSATTAAPVTQAFRLPAKLQSQTTQARLSVRIVASAGSCVAAFTCGTPLSAFIWPQYSTDNGATWHDLCGDSTVTPSVDVTQSPSTTPYNSSFCTIQTGGFADVLLRIVGYGGDDATTFQASLIELELSP